MRMEFDDTILILIIICFIAFLRFCFLYEIIFVEEKKTFLFYFFILIYIFSFFLFFL